MIPDLRSSRAERNTSKIGFLPWALERETDWRNAANDWVDVRYEVVKVSRLLSRKDLYVRVATLEFIRFFNEPVETGKELRCGTH